MGGQAPRSSPRRATYETVTAASSTGTNCWREKLNWWIFIGLMLYTAALIDGATNALGSAGDAVSPRRVYALAEDTGCAAPSGGALTSDPGILPLLQGVEDTQPRP